MTDRVEVAKALAVARVWGVMMLPPRLEGEPDEALSEGEPETAKLGVPDSALVPVSERAGQSGVAPSPSESVCGATLRTFGRSLVCDLHDGHRGPHHARGRWWHSEPRRVVVAPLSEPEDLRGPSGVGAPLAATPGATRKGAPASGSESGHHPPASVRPPTELHSVPDLEHAMALARHAADDARDEAKYQRAHGSRYAAEDLEQAAYAFDLLLAAVADLQEEGS